MLFPTIEFALFFALVFPVTWLLNDYNTAKKWFLVAASYFFYASWNASYTLILLGSSLFSPRPLPPPTPAPHPARQLAVQFRAGARP
jgi:hypothetical protein